MRILISHPEGNLSYNPNLRGILEIFSEAGHQVTYLGRGRENLPQKASYTGIRTIYADSSPAYGTFVFGDPALFSGFDLMIGVDRGIIEISHMAQLHGTPFGLISYEIFSHEEVEPERKQPELDACSQLAFATAPDDVRSGLLAKANEINPERIIHIPVAGRAFLAPASKPAYFHETYQLKPEQKVALYMGSLAAWTAAEFLISSTRHWPEDWVMVLHERFGPSRENLAIIDQLGNPDQIIISSSPFDDTSDMTDFIASADVGIAAYHPTYENEWLGLNIAHIGLAAGKVSTYLQHGVPVATHDLGLLSDLIAEYGAGQIFSLQQPFIPNDPPEQAKNGCRRLFETHLDLDRHKEILLQTITRVVKDWT